MFCDFLLHFTPGVDSNLERLLKSFPWKMTSCFHHNQTALLKNFEIIQSSYSYYKINSLFLLFKTKSKLLLLLSYIFL